MANRPAYTVTTDIYSNNSTRSAYNFSDELLLALERSGKTLLQIQALILPWGNEESEDAIVVNGRGYCNDDKTLSDSIQKKARIRELLEATLTAKEQAHIAVKDMEEKYELLTENMKAAGERFRYLADVAKRLFGVTISNKRKISSETPLRCKIAPGPCGFRMRRRLFGDSDVGEEEKCPQKKGISYEVVAENGTGKGGIVTQQLKKLDKVSHPTTYKAPAITSRLQLELESFLLSTRDPERRETSVEAYMLPNFKLDEVTPQIKHRGDRGMDGVYGKRSCTATNALQNDDEFENRTSGICCSIGNTSGDSFRRMAMKSDFQVLRIPKTAADSTWKGRCSKTHPANGALRGIDFLLNSSETSDSMAEIQKTGRYIGDRADYDSESTCDGSDDSNFISSGSESFPSKKAPNGSVQMQHNNMDINDTEVNRAALREHKRQIEHDYRNENYEVPRHKTTSYYRDTDSATEEELDMTPRLTEMGDNSYMSGG